jgi:hypothetical protein
MTIELRLWFHTLAILVLVEFGRGFDDRPRPGNLPAATAFLHVNVIPMDREQALEVQTVGIEGDRLTRVGPSKAIRVRQGTRRIEAKGKYLIPGLVDAHVHLQSQTEFPLYLANGVTTVFNLDGRPAHLIWGNQVANGEILGPTIFSTGPTFHRKRSAEEDVRLVDEQADPRALPATILAMSRKRLITTRRPWRPKVPTRMLTSRRNSSSSTRRNSWSPGFFRTKT